MQTPQRYCSVIEGNQVDIQAVFKCNRKKHKSKTKKRKETNSAQHKGKYLSLFKLGHEKYPSSACLVYLLMHVSSVFVLGTFAKLNVIMMMIIIKIMIVIEGIITIVIIIMITILLVLVILLIIMIITIKK